MEIKGKILARAKRRISKLDRDRLAIFSSASESDALWLRSLVLSLSDVDIVDPFFSFRLVEKVERDIESGKVTNLGPALFGQKVSDEYDSLFGKPFMDDYWRVYLGTIFAAYKLMLYRVGLISPRRKGDLSAATAEGDILKIYCRLFRLRWIRDSKKDWIATIMEEPRPRADYARLWAALHCEPYDFSQLKKGFEIEDLLLNGWISPSSAGNVSWPPFAYCTDKALKDIFEILMPNLPYSSNALKSKWERLGLKRSTFASLARVQRDGKQLIISEAKRSGKAGLPTRFPSVPVPPFLFH